MTEFGSHEISPDHGKGTEFTGLPSLGEETSQSKALSEIAHDGTLSHESGVQMPPVKDEITSLHQPTADKTNEFGIFIADDYDDEKEQWKAEEKEYPTVSHDRTLAVQSANGANTTPHSDRKTVEIYHAEDTTPDVTELRDHTERKRTPATPTVAKMKSDPFGAIKMMPKFCADKGIAPSVLSDQRVQRKLIPLLGTLTRKPNLSAQNVRMSGRLSEPSYPGAPYTGTPEENMQIFRAIRFSERERTRSRQAVGIGSSPILEFPPITLDSEVAERKIVVVGAGAAGIEMAASLRILGYKNIVIINNEDETKGIWKKGNLMMEDRRRNNPVDFCLGAKHKGIEAILPRTPGKLESMTMFLDNPGAHDNDTTVNIVRNGQIINVQANQYGNAHEIAVLDTDTDKKYYCRVPKYINTIGTGDDTTATQDVERPGLLDPKNDTKDSRWRVNCSEDKANELRDTYGAQDVRLVNYGNGKLTLVVEPREDYLRPKDTYGAEEVTDYLDEISRRTGGLEKYIKRGDVTSVVSDDYYHLITYKTANGEVHTMESSHIIFAPGLGEPTPLNKPGKMETNATDDDIYSRYQFHIPEDEEHLWHGRNVLIVGAGNSAFEMVPQFQKMKKEKGIDVDYQVVTHLPREAMINPGFRIKKDGKEYELGRSDANPKGLALDLKHIFDAYTEALAEDRIISDVKRWDVEGDQIFITQTDGSQIILENDVNLPLTGFEVPKEKLEALGMIVLDNGQVACDYDGAIAKNLGAIGSDRIVKGAYIIGPATKTRPGNIGGIQDAIGDAVLSLVIGTYEDVKIDEAIIEKKAKEDGVSDQNTRFLSRFRKKTTPIVDSQLNQMAEKRLARAA